jgi:hypothetical protein
MDPDSPPAIRPSAPSPVIQSRETQDSHRAAVAASCHCWSFSTTAKAEVHDDPARQACSAAWTGSTAAGSWRRGVG